MSIMGDIGSTTMTTTNIPIPKDQIIPFEGRTYSTIAVCEDQIAFAYWALSSLFMHHWISDQ
jgi:hypothetical protein